MVDIKQPISNGVKVLMISIDKGLLGKNPLGDVITRHGEYGKYVDQMDIVVFSGAGTQDYKISDNVSAFATNSKSKFSYYADGLKIAKNLAGKNNYDLVITMEPFLTGLVGKKIKQNFGTKLLVHFHGDFWKNPAWLWSSPLNFIFLIISQGVVKTADAIRVMSEGQKEKLMNNGVLENKITVISTPVDVERFENFDHQKAVTSQAEKKVILMVGRKDPIKDFPTLFKAVSLAYEVDKNISLWLVGNYRDQERDELDLPKDLDVKFFPSVAAENLPAYYYGADVIVLSSKSESFGKVLVEAGACGKPVISTATTGAKEIIQDQYNGYLVPIGDHAELSNKILHLLRNEKDAELMGEHGRQLVNEKFSNNLEKIINLWKELAK